MSRAGAAEKKPKPSRAAGTPIWVWVVYALGLLGAAVFVGTILFNVGALYLSDEGDEFTVNVSVLGFAVWGGLMALAGGLWIWRRRKGRR